jgi:hypothetical protein
VKKRIDADHRGLRLSGRWMMAEAIVIILLAVGDCIYKRFS